MDRKLIHPELFNADNMLSAYFRQRYACGAFPFNAGKEDEYDHEVDEGIAYDNPSRRAFIYEIAALDDKA